MESSPFVFRLVYMDASICALAPVVWQLAILLIIVLIGFVGLTSHLNHFSRHCHSLAIRNLLGVAHSYCPARHSHCRCRCPGSQNS